MSKPDYVKCGNCIFWETHAAGSSNYDYGLCHRYPPTPTKTPERLIEGIRAIYSAVSGLPDNELADQFAEPGYIREYSDKPSTERIDWCGEFKAEWPS